MHCRGGRAKILAHGLRATCYTLKRQNREHFGGLRETVLERDGHRCRVSCRAVVHFLISLYTGCHARVHRTKAVLLRMPPLLLRPWREQHPCGQEQRALCSNRTTKLESWG